MEPKNNITGALSKWERGRMEVRGRVLPGREKMATATPAKATDIEAEKMIT